MLIQRPNGDQIKFFIPEVVDEIDATTTPVLRNITGADILGDAIADDGVIVGAWDGIPQVRPTILTQLLEGADSDFSEDTGNWDTSDAGVSIAGGKLVFTAVAIGDGAEIILPLVNAVKYATELTTSGVSANGVKIVVGGTSGADRTTDNTFPEDITAGATAILRIEAVTGATTINVDSITAAHKATWRIDTELARRPLGPLDTVILAQHNLLDAYASAIRSVVNFYANTADALPTDPLEISRTISGLLGEPGPVVRYDGVGAYTSVADDPNLNFGTTDFSVEWRGKIRTEGAVLISKQDTLGVPASTGWALWTRASDPHINFLITDGVNFAQLSSIPTNYADGAEHHIVVAVDKSTDIRLYIDKILIATTATGVPAIGDVSNAIPLQMARDYNAGAGGSYLDGDQNYAVLHNHALTEGEVTDRFDSPQAYPTAIELLANNTQLLTAWANRNFAGFISTGATIDAATSAALGQNCYSAINPSPGDIVTVRYTLAMFSGAVADINIRSASNNSLTAGSFSLSAVPVVGDNVHTFIAAGDDDFIGFVDANTNGVSFNATRWSMQIEGAPAAYLPDGISISQGKLLDASRNQLHGVINDADIWYAPDPNSPGYFLQQLVNPTRDRYLFNEVNPAALEALEQALIGWIAWCRTYEYEMLAHTGGYNASINAEGVSLGQSDAGVIIGERRFGLRPSWTVTLIATGISGFTKVQDMIERLQISLYPWYIAFDWEDADPVLWQVRLDPSIPLQYVTGDDEGNTWEGITFVINAEGR